MVRIHRIGSITANIGLTNCEEMWPQSAYSVLHHVSGQLRASGTKCEHTNHAINVVYRIWYAHAQEVDLAVIVRPVEVLN